MLLTEVKYIDQQRLGWLYPCTLLLFTRSTTMELVFFTAHLLLVHFRVFQQQTTYFARPFVYLLEGFYCRMSSFAMESLFPFGQVSSRHIWYFGTCCESSGCELIGFFVVKKHQFVFHNWGASWAYRTSVWQRCESVNKETRKHVSHGHAQR